MRSPGTVLLICLTATLSLTLAGCSDGRPTADPTTHPATHPSGPTVATARAAQDKNLLTPYGLPAPKDGSGDDTSSGGAVEDYAAPSPASGAVGSATSGGELPVPSPAPSGTGGPGDGAPLDLSNAALRAGFVDDNADFAAYEKYRAGYHGPSRALSVDGRHVVTVTDPDGMPLLGAAVTVDGTTALSHVDGRALFFGVAPGDAVSVAYADRKATGTLGDDLVTTIPIDTARTTEGLTLDLNLVLDTTGSMGDEINRLNTSLSEVATRLDALPSHPAVRYGLTVYKDHHDAYVFRTHDFTDLATFQKELKGTTAGGGDDTPEALDEAFHGAVDGPSWGQDESSVELLLLVSDAPSHIPGDSDTTQGNQTPDGTSTYDVDAKGASRRGIEVVPIAASGTDDTAEYEFRQLAEHTLGTFFFLTYDMDGAPGDGTDHHVSGYQTGDLGDLIVDHVSARLAAYSVKAGDPVPTPSPTPSNAN